MEHNSRNILPTCKNHVAIFPKSTILIQGKDGEKSTKLHSLVEGQKCLIVHENLYA